MITNYNVQRDDKNGQFYINLSLYNPTTTGKIVNVDRIFDEVIVPNPSKYQCSLIRSNLYTNDLPIIDMRQYLQNSSTTQYDLYITFTFLGVDYTRNLVFTQFSDTTDLDRYYIYNYINFAKMINDTLSLLSNDINTVVPGTITDIPIIQYIPELGRFSIFAEQSVFNDSSGTVQIWFNNTLYDLLNSLPKIFTSSVSPKNIRLSIREIVNPNGINNINTTNFTNPVLEMIQQYQSLELLNSARSLIFNTNLPVVLEYDDEANRYGDTQVYPTKVNRLNSTILTGINGNIFKENTYIPTAEFQMLDLEGTTPIYRIQIQAFWIDNLGIYHNMYLSPRRTATFKILFRKKYNVVS